MFCPFSVMASLDSFMLGELRVFVYLPAPGQKHGSLDEHGTRQQYIPAGAQLALAEIRNRISNKERQLLFKPTFHCNSVVLYSILTY